MLTDGEIELYHDLKSRAVLTRVIKNPSRKCINKQLVAPGICSFIYVNREMEGLKAARILIEYLKQYFDSYPRESDGDTYRLLLTYVDDEPDTPATIIKDLILLQQATLGVHPLPPINPEARVGTPLSRVARSGIIERARLLNLNKWKFLEYPLIEITDRHEFYSVDTLISCAAVLKRHVNYMRFAVITRVTPEGCLGIVDCACEFIEAIVFIEDPTPFTLVINGQVLEYDPDEEYQFLGLYTESFNDIRMYSSVSRHIHVIKHVMARKPRYMTDTDPTIIKKSISIDKNADKIIELSHNGDIMGGYSDERNDEYNIKHINKCIENGDLTEGDDDPFYLFQRDWRFL